MTRSVFWPASVVSRTTAAITAASRAITSRMPIALPRRLPSERRGLAWAGAGRGRGAARRGGRLAGDRAVPELICHQTFRWFASRNGADEGGQ